MGRMWRTTTGRLVAAGFTVAIALGLATPAGAAGPGHYSISATGGATFQQFNAGNLVNGTSDDQLFYLSTTSTGQQHLPFPIKVWAGSFKHIAISSNGNVQMGILPGGGTSEYRNDCLPSATFPGTKPMVAPFWDDLYFDSNDTSEGFTEGVFTKTKGSSPHRKFIISWQGHRFSDAGTRVLAQVIFNQGSPTFTMVYGLSGGDSATIGTQSSETGSARQWSCNSGSTTTVVSGQKLTFLHAS